MENTKPPTDIEYYLAIDSTKFFIRMLTTHLLNKKVFELHPTLKAKAENARVLLRDAQKELEALRLNNLTKE